MTLFSLAELHDEKKALPAGVHRASCGSGCMATIEGLGIEIPPNPLFDWYYGLIDFEFWLRKYGGEDVVAWVKANVHPLDIVFRLAEDHGIVLLNGGGFEAPNWSVRVSFANLDDDVYDDIGRAVRAVARSYVMAFQASQAAAAAGRAGRGRGNESDRFVGVLRHHPEVTFFLVLGIGYVVGKGEAGKLHARRRHRDAAGRRGRRPARRAGLGRSQAVLLSAVPVLDRVQDRAAVLPRPEKRRPAAGGAVGDRRHHRA